MKSNLVNHIQHNSDVMLRTESWKTNLTLFAKFLQYDSVEDLQLVLSHAPFALVHEPPRFGRTYSYCLRFVYDTREHTKEDVAAHLGFDDFSQMCDVIHALQYKNKRMSIVQRKMDAHSLFLSLRIYSV